MRPSLTPLFKTVTATHIFIPFPTLFFSLYFTEFSLSPKLEYRVPWGQVLFKSVPH